MKLATLSNWRNHALAILSTAFLLNAAPSTAAAADVVTETLWRSYDITMQATTAQGALSSSTGKTPTVVDFYESTNDGGIAKGALLPGYFAGVHPDTFNRAQQVWSNSGSWLYPYVGKSTVVRGSDAGETNTPSPTGVRDLQMHPPVSAHLIVAAFRVPQSGDYSVLDLAVRRVNNNPGETSRLRVFNNAGAQIANLQATGPNWVRGAASYAAGTLAAGSYLYFAVDGDGSFSWDATEVAFTVRAASSIPPPSCSLMPTPSSLTVGGSSNLTWTATNATALTINQGIGTVTPASGSRSISPTVTTTYTATVTGPAGVATCATTVAVNAASAETLWRSYDIAMQASVAQGTLLSSAGKSPTVVDFYESTNDGGIGKGSLLPKYTLGVHPDAFNKAQQIWSAGTGSWLYSYVGKSTVNRGSDTDETNTPAPNGVRDFQMHAPNSARLIVAAFRAPQSGTYSVVDLAVRRVDTNANQTSRLRVFNAAGTQIANLQATGPAWVRGSASYSVGALTAGSYIYFAVDNDGAFAWDATEVAFTVRATSAAATTTPVVTTPVVTTPVVTVPVVTTPVVTTPVVTTPVVVKTSPKITGTPKTSTKANESYSFVPSASDADGDKLTFSIANKPAWLTFSTATGALTGTPTDAQVGIYRNVTIQVGSGGEYDTLAAFDIEVVSVGAKGVTLSWTPPTQNADGTALSNLAGYKIKYGTQTGVYTKEIAIANPGIAAYMVEGLTAGTYYFVITAYNSKGVESTVSNESSKKL